MTALPRRMYRDPAEQLLEAEAETCKGCAHRVVESTLTIAHCRNPNTLQMVADQRCDEYEEHE